MSSNNSPADKGVKHTESGSLSLTTGPDASAGETSTNFPTDRETHSETTQE